MTQCRDSPIAKCLAALAVFAALQLSLRGQTQAPPRPEFREVTDLAHIDVVALDGDRRPVRGLTAADFTLRIAGRVRPIRAFGAVEVPGPSRAAMTLAPWTRDVSPDVQTNTGPNDGRLVVIFFDRSIPAGPQFETARKIARAAINELGPNDLAALTAVRGGPAHDFTPDRARLLKAIDRLQSGALGSGTQAGLDEQAIDAGFPEAPALFRAHDACYCNACVLEQIRDIADELRDVTRPKVLLFIGSQLTINTDDINPVGRSDSYLVVECVGAIKLARDSMYRSMDLAGVTVHSLDPAGLQTVAGVGADSSIRGGRVMAQTSESRTLSLAYQGQIRVLPDRTGGRVVTNTNAPEVLVPAVMAESTAYYVLGFDEPPIADRGPKVEVTVTRRGVKVHVQRAFEGRRANEALSSGATATSGPWPAPNAGGIPNFLHAPSTLAARAVSSLLPVRGLPLSASVVPLASTGSGDPVALVVVGVDPVAAVNGDVVRPLSGPAELYVSALTMTAQSKSEERQSVDLGAALSRHHDVVSRLELKPGSYEIRAAVAADDGRTGSVITYVDVPNFRTEALSLSGLALTSMPAGTGVAARGADLLPFIPTARRTFAVSETLRSFVKVYQGGTDPIAPVQFEVRILDTRGQVMLNAGGPLDAGRWNPDRSADVGLDMPLLRLAPGEYLLSIEATEGKHSARRDVRFAISSF